MNELYRRRRDLVCDALAADRHAGRAAARRRSTSGRPSPPASRARPPTPSTCSRRPAVVISPGAIYGPAGEGWFRISLTTPDERLLEAVAAAGRSGAGLGDLRAACAPPRLVGEWKSRSGRTAPSGASRNGSEPAQRARQRAFCVGALGEGDDLEELGELLRTAGVAVVGEMLQRREAPHPNTYLGPGKVAEAKAAAKAADANLIACDDELTARQERNLEEADRPAGDRPHDRDPRHLRLPRGQRRGQAPGRARPARIQHGPHARAVEPPRAPRRRDRHEGPRRDPDRDRPPAGAQPHRGAAPAPRARQGHARRAAGRARAGRDPDDRAGRLHERRQVDAPERHDRRRGRGPRPALPHARPDHPDAADRRAALPADRHGRLHLASFPTSWWTPSLRRSRRHAAPSCWSTCSTARHPRSTRRHAGRPSSRRSRRSAPASSRGCWSSTRSTCSTRTSARELRLRHPEAVLVSAATGEGLDELGERARARAAPHAATRRSARALRRRWQPRRAARDRRRGHPQGHRRGRAGATPWSRPVWPSASRASPSPGWPAQTASRPAARAPRRGSAARSASSMGREGLARAMPSARAISQSANQTFLGSRGPCR